MSDFPLMPLTAGIVIGGALVSVRHPSDAMVALTHSPGMVAQLSDEDGKVVAETTDPDVAYNWSESDPTRRSRYPA